MKNYVQETSETLDSQFYHLQQSSHPLIYHSDTYQTPINANYSEVLTFETFQTCFYNFKIDQQFKRRTDANIVLILKKQPPSTSFNQKLSYRSKEKKGGEKKVKVKGLQKESRNVSSNVLRIFFKLVLQLGSYDVLIKRTIQKLNLSISLEDFNTWLLSFNINFKNYIRSTQIQKLLSASGSPEYKKTLIVILRHYLNNHAVTHCLTSKRIELESLKMHLGGLRELYQETVKLKQHLL